MNKFLLTSGLICSLASGLALASQPTAPADLDGVISAQVGVSKGDVDKFLRDLMQDGGDQTFQHADFKKKALKFSQDVDGAMQAFELAMKGKVFAEIKLYADDYNSIYNSTTYSPEEKTALMGQLYKQADASLAHSLAQYESEVTKLVDISGIHPLYFAVTEGGSGDNEYWDYVVCETDTLKQIDVHTKRDSWSDDGAPATPPAFISQSFMTFIYPQINEGCYSSSCVTLSLVMYTKYITLLETSFLKDMTVLLADGKELVIKASGLKGELTSNVLELIVDPSLPKEVDALPFDISEDDLPKAIADAYAKSAEGQREIAAAHAAEDAKLLATRNSLIVDVTAVLSELKKSGDENWFCTYMDGGELKAGGKILSDLKSIVQIKPSYVGPSSYLSGGVTSQERDSILQNTKKGLFKNHIMNVQATCLDSLIAEAVKGN